MDAETSSLPVSCREKASTTRRVSATDHPYAHLVATTANRCNIMYSKKIGRIMIRGDGM